MRYRLRKGLSFCHVDGSLIFLDIDNDRYFCLPAKLECAFVRHMQGGQATATDINRLVENKILIKDQGLESEHPPLEAKDAHRSVIEQKIRAVKPNLNDLLNVFTAVVSTQTLLKRRKLNSVLHRLTDHRGKEGFNPRPDLVNLYEHDLSVSACIFMRARRYIPVEPCCLLDSLAMVRFLAKRRFRANIVFGVTRDPFSAHCWVQANDLVLNDSVGSTKAYTPIRVA